MCRKRLSSPRCRSELIDSAWVVIVDNNSIKKICLFPFSKKAYTVESRFNEPRREIVRSAEGYLKSILSANTDMQTLMGLI